jgi:hypothetical protein
VPLILVRKRRFNSNSQQQEPDGRLGIPGLCSWVFQGLEKNMLLSFRLSMVSSALALCVVATSSIGSGLQSQDLYRFRSVSQIEFSLDGRHIADAMPMNDRPGRPYTQISSTNGGMLEQTAVATAES